MIKFRIFIFYYLTVSVCISCNEKNENHFITKEKQTKTEKQINFNNEISTRTDTLIWHDELCTIYGEFDTSKYTKIELKDTYKLWFNFSYYIDFQGYPVFELEEKTKTIDELEKLYLEKKNEIENLRIVKDSNWENLRELQLLKLKAFYEYKKRAFFAYRNTSLLAETKYNVKAKVYVDALISDDSIQLINAWKLLNEEQKAINGYPEMVEKKFRKRLNSSFCLAYAKMDLFTFGWSNNVEKIPEEYELKYQQFIEENDFKNLFLKTSMECDEP